jgi:hypothetical protein
VKATDDASPTFSSSSRGTNKDSSTSGARTTVTDKPATTDYTSQDVFERLQKTTTEAYAKKSTPRYDEI